MTERTITTYDDALKFLLAFTDYEKITKYKYDLAAFDLGRVVELMKAVGSPQKQYRSAHVAGTKGKGSTAGMIQCILTAAGFRTGLYTSPHLTRTEERMTVDGEMMSEAEFVEIVNELAPYTAEARTDRPNESPTYFELVTAIGFRHFARRKVDFASVEVGMGGRLDATNIILPEVSVITRVDYDHEERLGHTLDKIAFEKGGIIKPGIPLVCAPQEPDALGTIVELARQRGAPMTLVGRDCALENVRTRLDRGATPQCTFDLKTPRRAYRGLSLRLLGEHQALNAACAVTAVETMAERCRLDVPEDAVRRGLESARGRARLEVFAGRPTILLDGAHNPASMRALCATLDGVFPGKRLVLLMGVSRDKNAAEMFKMVLPRAGALIFTQSNSPRAAEPEYLAALALESCGVKAETQPDAMAAYARAKELAGPDDLLCITGSFFLAGMLRPTLLSEFNRANVRLNCEDLTEQAMRTILLLTISNAFMTFAWYGHLKFKEKPLLLVILASWGIAFLEYCFQVPANRIGSYEFGDTAKLKTIQEVITLVVFCLFSILYLREPLKWNYLVGFGLVVAGVFFVFKKW